jgi:ribosomal protein S18 acetylase RimI-like enzyme
MMTRTRKDRGLILSTIAGILFLLIVVTAWNPDLFGIVVGIIGTTGALLVLYEVNHTKRIAQATFVRDLNTAFTTDQSISELWRKLLLDEPIEPSDRPLVSSYLTFFETIHLLLDREVIDLDLVDNLFRNRFFTAVGKEEIHRMALFSQSGAFLNIHDLVHTWSTFVARQGVPQHDGYYKYLDALAKHNGFTVLQLNKQHVDDVIALQDTVTTHLRERDWLRENHSDMWIDCVQNHVTLGVIDSQSKLVAAAVLYDGGEGNESVASYITSDRNRLAASINLKVVLVSPKNQRNQLAHTLIALLEQRARDAGKREILCTIHKGNKASQFLFKRAGYQKVTSAETKYGKREIYGRSLVPPDIKRTTRRYLPQ